MATRYYRGKIMNRPDGSILQFPPDAVFDPPDMGAPDLLGNSNYGVQVTGATQYFSKGTRFQDVWGRVFRYVEFGGTIAQNSLVQAEAPDGDHDDIDIVAAVAGDTSVVTTTTITVLVNEYAGGWLFSELLVSGHAYPISSHAAFTTAAATFNLWYAIQVAIAADADVSLVKSQYSEVIIAPHSTPTGALVGVCAGSGAGDGDFGWVQTRGLCKVLTNGTVVVGEPVTLGSTTDGTVDPYNEDGTENLPIVGRVVNVGPTTEWSLIDIALE